MGQRSQIYVSLRDGVRNKEGVIADGSTKELTALYFHWNFGSRMISRAKGLIAWLKGHAQYITYEKAKIKRIAETNFDFRDIVDSQDLIAEAEEYATDCAANVYIFQWADNNDGKLFISLEDDGSIKYCFTDDSCTAPMTAEEYMKWDTASTEAECGSNYAENCKWLKENATLMTAQELDDFINAQYNNVRENKEYLEKKDNT